MPNQLSNAMLAQLFAQESTDPFLILVTLTHASFPTVYLVDNSVDIISRGNTYIAFPMKIRLSPDDGETAKDIAIEFDNVSLELINEIRQVTDPIGVKIEMILASMPDVVQMQVDELKIASLSYNSSKVSASLIMDSFLTTEMTSEKYTPTIFPGLF